MPSHPSQSHPWPRVPAARRGTPEERVVALLRAGVPLSLLLDLAGSDPHSQELYSSERSAGSLLPNTAVS